MIRSSYNYHALGGDRQPPEGLKTSLHRSSASRVPEEMSTIVTLGRGRRYLTS